MEGFSVFLLCSCVALAGAANITENSDPLQARNTSQHATKGNVVREESERANYGNPGNSFRYIITTLGQPSQASSGGSAPLYGSQQSSAAYGSAQTPAPTYQTTPAPVYQTSPPVYGQQQAVANMSMIGGPCASNSDCAMAKNSRCVAGVCACNAGTVALSTIACVPLATSFGSNCVISAQCRNLDPLASCYLDRCICEGIYNVMGQNCATTTTTSDYFGGPSTTNTGGFSCVRKMHLGQPCCTQNQCAYEVWNSTCTAGICVCLPGFVNIGSHACAPVRNAIGDPCSVDTQCSLNIVGGVCGLDGRCTCNSNGFVLVGGTATTAGGAAAAPGAMGLRRKRQTQTGGTCLPTAVLGATCVNSLQCTSVTTNAVCSSAGRCTCAPFYVRLDGICLPTYTGLGLNAVQAGPAAAAGANMNDGSPICVLSKQCLTQSAICGYTIDLCDCNNATHCIVNNACAPKNSMNGPCSDSCQCTTANAVCTSGNCACSSGFMFNDQNNMCIMKAMLGQACTFNAQCGTIANAICDSTGKCSCSPAGFVNPPATSSGAASLTACLPVAPLDAPCATDMQCQASTLNTRCSPTTSRCVCRNLNIFLPYMGRCLRYIRGVDEFSMFVTDDNTALMRRKRQATATNGGVMCEINEQCLTTGTICNGTTTMRRCSCNTDRYCRVGNMCALKNGMNGVCSDNCQCTTLNSVCSSGNCACSSGFAFNDNNNACVRQAVKFAAESYAFSVPCCRGANATVQRFLGQLMVSSTSTTDPKLNVFTIDAPATLYVLYPSTGFLYVQAGVNPTATGTYTATVSASGLSVSSLATVVLIPEACCSAAFSASMSTLNGGVLLLTGTVGATKGGCNNADTPSPIIMTPSTNLFSSPCGEMATQSSFMPTGSMPVCAVSSSGVVSYASATIIPTGGTITCSFTSMATSCNGMMATVTFSITVSADAATCT